MGHQSSVKHLACLVTALFFLANFSSATAFDLFDFILGNDGFEDEGFSVSESKSSSVFSDSEHFENPTKSYAGGPMRYEDLGPHQQKVGHQMHEPVLSEPMGRPVMNPPVMDPMYQPMDPMGQHQPIMMQGERPPQRPYYKVTPPPRYYQGKPPRGYKKGPPQMRPSYQGPPPRYGPPQQTKYY